MKLASLKSGSRDGTLVVVAHGLDRAVAVPTIAATLQHALDHWDTHAPRLNDVAERLADAAVGARIDGSDVFALDPTALASPLPRA